MAQLYWPAKSITTLYRLVAVPPWHFLPPERAPSARTTESTSPPHPGATSGSRGTARPASRPYGSTPHPRSPEPSPPPRALRRQPRRQRRAGRKAGNLDLMDRHLHRISVEANVRPPCQSPAPTPGAVPAAARRAGPVLPCSRAPAEELRPRARTKHTREPEQGSPALSADPIGYRGGAVCLRITALVTISKSSLALFVQPCPPCSAVSILCSGAFDAA